MPLLNQPVIQYQRDDGTVEAFARVYFYNTGTTDPADVYADADLITPHTWPVVADDQGFFPPIYYSSNLVLRAVFTDQNGDLDNPLLDIDPVNVVFQVGSSNLIDGAIEEKLGYTPVDPAAAVFTAPARMNFEPTELNVDDVGFRGTPTNIKDVAYTIEVADSGRLLMKTGSTAVFWTLPQDIFPIGHHFYVYNGNTENLTIERDGVELREAGDSTNEDKVIPPYYYGKVTQVMTNVWLLSPALPSA